MPVGAAAVGGHRLARTAAAAYERTACRSERCTKPGWPLPGSARSGARSQERLAAGMPGLALACAAARDRAKAQAWLDAAEIDCPLVELDEFPDHADLAVECAPAAILEQDLHADARGRQAGDGAQRRRPAAAPASDRARQGAWRPDHRADRRTARPRRGLRRGGGQHQFGAHDHPQAAGRPRGRALSRRSTASRSRASTRRSWCFPAPPAKPPPASPPTSTWWRRCRSPASDPTAPPSRSGPIPR